MSEIFDSNEKKKFEINISIKFQKCPEETLTFDSLKKILSESNEIKKAEEEERRSRITKAFRSASFQELIKCTQSKVYIILLGEK